MSDKVSDTTEYETVKHAVETSDDVFGIDLSIMKQGMTAEELNTWKTRVDFSATNYVLYPSLNDANNESNAITGVIGTGNVLPAAFVTEKIDKNATSNVSVKDKANYISVKVDDAQAAASTLTLFTTYYMRVEFNSSSSATTPLNSIIVPVEFTAPTVAEQYKAKSGLEKDGAVYGFMSNTQNFTGTGIRPAYAIEDAFEKAAAGATYTVEADLIDGLNNVKSSDEFVQAVISGDAYVGFKDAVPGENKVQDAYAKAFTLKAYSDDYKGWAYPADGQYTDYKFKMILMSPIYDGSFAEGTTLTVNGGQDFKFTNDQLKFSDYNNTPVKILQDAWDDTVTPAVGAWSDTRIANVTPDDDNDMLDNEGKLDIVDADWDATAKKVIEGYITGKAGSVAVDGTENLHIKIKDNMGYTRTFKIPVTIKANK